MVLKYKILRVRFFFFLFRMKKGSQLGNIYNRKGNSVLKQKSKEVSQFFPMLNIFSKALVPQDIFQHHHLFIKNQRPKKPVKIEKDPHLQEDLNSIKTEFDNITLSEPKTKALDSQVFAKLLPLSKNYTQSEFFNRKIEQKGDGSVLKDRLRERGFILENSLEKSMTDPFFQLHSSSPKHSPHPTPLNSPTKNSPPKETKTVKKPPPNLPRPRLMSHDEVNKTKTTKAPKKLRLIPKSPISPETKSESQINIPEASEITSFFDDSSSILSPKSKEVKFDLSNIQLSPPAKKSKKSPPKKKKKLRKKKPSPEKSKSREIDSNSTLSDSNSKLQPENKIVDDDINEINNIEFSNDFNMRANDELPSENQNYSQFNIIQSNIQEKSQLIAENTEEFVAYSTIETSKEYITDNFSKINNIVADEEFQPQFNMKHSRNFQYIPDESFTDSNLNNFQSPFNINEKPLTESTNLINNNRKSMFDNSFFNDSDFLIPNFNLQEQEHVFHELTPLKKKEIVKENDDDEKEMVTPDNFQELAPTSLFAMQEEKDLNNDGYDNSYIHGDIKKTDISPIFETTGMVLKLLPESDFAAISSSAEVIDKMCENNTFSANYSDFNIDFANDPMFSADKFNIGHEAQNIKSSIIDQNIQQIKNDENIFDPIDLINQNEISNMTDNFVDQSLNTINQNLDLGQENEQNKSIINSQIQNDFNLKDEGILTKFHDFNESNLRDFGEFTSVYDAKSNNDITKKDQFNNPEFVSVIIDEEISSKDMFLDDEFAVIQSDPIKFDGDNGLICDEINSQFTVPIADDFTKSFAETVTLDDKQKEIDESSELKERNYDVFDEIQENGTDVSQSYNYNIMGFNEKSVFNELKNSFNDASQINVSESLLSPSNEDLKCETNIESIDTANNEDYFSNLSLQNEIVSVSQYHEDFNIVDNETKSFAADDVGIVAHSDLFSEKFNILEKESNILISNENNFSSNSIVSDSNNLHCLDDAQSKLLVDKENLDSLQSATNINTKEDIQIENPKSYINDASNSAVRPFIDCESIHMVVSSQLMDTNALQESSDFMSINSEIISQNVHDIQTDSINGITSNSLLIDSSIVAEDIRSRSQNLSGLKSSELNQFELDELKDIYSENVARNNLMINGETENSVNKLISPDSQVQIRDDSVNSFINGRILSVSTLRNSDSSAQNFIVVQTSETESMKSLFDPVSQSMARQFILSDENLKFNNDNQFISQDKLATDDLSRENDDTFTRNGSSLKVNESTVKVPFMATGTYDDVDELNDVYSENAVKDRNIYFDGKELINDQELYNSSKQKSKKEKFLIAATDSQEKMVGSTLDDQLYNIGEENLVDDSRFDEKHNEIVKECHDDHSRVIAAKLLSRDINILDDENQDDIILAQETTEGLSSMKDPVSEQKALDIIGTAEKIENPFIAVDGSNKIIALSDPISEQIASRIQQETLNADDDSVSNDNSMEILTENINKEVGNRAAFIDPETQNQMKEINKYNANQFESFTADDDSQSIIGLSDPISEKIASRIKQETITMDEKIVSKDNNIDVLIENSVTDINNDAENHAAFIDPETQNQMIEINNNENQFDSFIAFDGSEKITCLLDPISEKIATRIKQETLKFEDESSFSTDEILDENKHIKHQFAVNDNDISSAAFIDPETQNQMKEININNANPLELFISADKSENITALSDPISEKIASRILDLDESSVSKDEINEILDKNKEIKDKYTISRDNEAFIDPETQNQMNEIINSSINSSFIDVNVNNNIVALSDPILEQVASRIKQQSLSINGKIVSKDTIDIDDNEATTRAFIDPETQNEMNEISNNNTDMLDSFISEELVDYCTLFIASDSDCVIHELPPIVSRSILCLLNVDDVDNEIIVDPETFNEIHAMPDQSSMKAANEILLQLNPLTSGIENMKDKTASQELSQIYDAKSDEIFDNISIDEVLSSGVMTSNENIEDLENSFEIIYTSSNENIKEIKDSNLFIFKSDDFANDSRRLVVPFIASDTHNLMTESEEIDHHSSQDVKCLIDPISQHHLETIIKDNSEIHEKGTTNISELESMNEELSRDIIHDELNAASYPLITSESQREVFVLNDPFTLMLAENAIRNSSIQNLQQYDLISSQSNLTSNENLLDDSQIVFSLDEEVEEAEFKIGNEKQSFTNMFGCAIDPDTHHGINELLDPTKQDLLADDEENFNPDNFFVHRIDNITDPYKGIIVNEENVIGTTRNRSVAKPGVNSNIFEQGNQFGDVSTNITDLHIFATSRRRSIAKPHLETNQFDNELSYDNNTPIKTNHDVYEFADLSCGFACPTITEFVDSSIRNIGINTDYEIHELTTKRSVVSAKSRGIDFDYEDETEQRNIDYIPEHMRYQPEDDAFTITTSFDSMAVCNEITCLPDAQSILIVEGFTADKINFVDNEQIQLIDQFEHISQEQIELDSSINYSNPNMTSLMRPIQSDERLLYSSVYSFESISEDEFTEIEMIDDDKTEKVQKHQYFIDPSTNSMNMTELASQSRLTNNDVSCVSTDNCKFIAQIPEFSSVIQNINFGGISIRDVTSLNTEQNDINDKLINAIYHDSDYITDDEDEVSNVEFNVDEKSAEINEQENNVLDNCSIIEKNNNEQKILLSDNNFTIIKEMLSYESIKEEMSGINSDEFSNEVDLSIQKTPDVQDFSLLNAKESFNNNNNDEVNINYLMPEVVDNAKFGSYINNIDDNEVKINFTIGHINNNEFRDESHLLFVNNAEIFSQHKSNQNNDESSLEVSTNTDNIIMNTVVDSHATELFGKSNDMILDQTAFCDGFIAQDNPSLAYAESDLVDKTLCKLITTEEPEKQELTRFGSVRRAKTREIDADFDKYNLDDKFEKYQMDEEMIDKFALLNTANSNFIDSTHLFHSFNSDNITKLCSNQVSNKSSPESMNITTKFAIEAEKFDIVTKQSPFIVNDEMFVEHKSKRSVIGPATSKNNDEFPFAIRSNDIMSSSITDSCHIKADMNDNDMFCIKSTNNKFAEVNTISNEFMNENLNNDLFNRISNEDFIIRNTDLFINSDIADPFAPRSIKSQEEDNSINNFVAEFLSIPNQEENMLVMKCANAESFNISSQEGFTDSFSIKSQENDSFAPNENDNDAFVIKDTSIYLAEPINEDETLQFVQNPIILASDNNNIILDDNSITKDKEISQEEIKVQIQDEGIKEDPSFESEHFLDQSQYHDVNTEIIVDDQIIVEKSPEFVEDPKMLEYSPTVDTEQIVANVYSPLAENVNDLIITDTAISVEGSSFAEDKSKISSPGDFSSVNELQENLIPNATEQAVEEYNEIKNEAKKKHRRRKKKEEEIPIQEAPPIEVHHKKKRKVKAPELQETPVKIQAPELAVQKEKIAPTLMMTPINSSKKEAPNLSTPFSSTKKPAPTLSTPSNTHKFEAPALEIKRVKMVRPAPNLALTPISTPIPAPSLEISSRGKHKKRV